MEMKSSPCDQKIYLHTRRPVQLSALSLGGMNSNRVTMKFRQRMRINTRMMNLYIEGQNPSHKKRCLKRAQFARNTCLVAKQNFNAHFATNCFIWSATAS